MACGGGRCSIARPHHHHNTAMPRYIGILEDPRTRSHSLGCRKTCGREGALVSGWCRQEEEEVEAVGRFDIDGRSVYEGVCCLEIRDGKDA